MIEDTAQADTSEVEEGKIDSNSIKDILLLLQGFGKKLEETNVLEKSKQLLMI